MDLDGDIDWPQENLLGRKISTFEENITCPICQEFFNNPQILRCGHSYCSLCIRRHFDRTMNMISYDVCPSCREKADTFDLRKNVALANLVEKYKELRKNLHHLVLSSNIADTDASTSRSKLRHSKGVSIVDRVAQYNCHGMTKEKVKKAIADVTKSSSVKLNTDGDKDELERRLRELIHLINAQIGSANPLTLEEAISTINANEKALEKETRKRQSQSVNNQEETFSKGFQELTQKALELKKRRCENESINSSKESIIEDTLKMKDSSWRVVASKEFDRPFYYNVNSKIGQFKVPPNFEFPPSPFSAIDNEARHDCSKDFIDSHQVKTIQPHNDHSQNTVESYTHPIVPNSVDLSSSDKNDSAVQVSGGKKSENFSGALSSSWNCSICTFLNASNGPKCNMCDSANLNFSKVTTRRSYRNTPHSPAELDSAAPKSIVKTRNRKN